MNKVFGIHIVPNRYHRLQKQPREKLILLGIIIPGEGMLNQVEGRRGMTIGP